MKKNKFILTVLVFALALCMLVACGENRGILPGATKAVAENNPLRITITI